MMDLYDSCYLNFILLSLATIYLAYIYMTRHFNYWKKRNIPFIKPTPFVGNFYEIATFKIHASLGLKNIYDKMDEPLIGFYAFDQPILMIKSPKLINDILKKDSINFVDRTVANPSMYSKYLFFQRNPEWNVTRNKLSQLFTPSKIKKMFPLVNDVSQELVKVIRKDIVLDVKNLIDKFTAEFIGRCYFGITDNCLENDQSVFLEKIKGIFGFSWRNALVQTNYFFKPQLANILKLEFINPQLVKYFRNVVLDTLKFKRNVKKISNDFIDIYKEIYGNSKDESEESSQEELDDISTHILMFTLGSETVGATLSFVMYELAINKDIQDRLRDELDNIVDKSSSITYETLQKTKFLDYCILETMRKYPIVPLICRKSSKDYTFRGTNIKIDKGTWIYIPIYALSNDDKHFPDPDKFNPDRFENFKTEGETFFLPFGGGPRICIGERFGIMVMKLAIIYIILNFKLDKCFATPEKIEFEPKGYVLRSKVELKIKIKPISK